MMRTNVMMDDEVLVNDSVFRDLEEEDRSPDDGRKEKKYNRSAETSDFSTRSEPDAIKLYLKEIRKTPLLTFEQEQELGKRVAEGDVEARARMIEANLRLVVSIGKKYINRGMPFSGNYPGTFMI